MKSSYVALGILFVIFVAAINPCLLIWGLQYMGVPIVLTWTTWIGAFLVCAALQGSVYSNK